MVVYADTSFLFSLYAQDANTAQAGEVASGLRAPLAFTPWHRHELRNAFRLALFRGEMTAQQCETLLATTEADLQAGALAETALAWGDVFGEAEALSAAKVAKLGTRAADVLHVAAAVTLGSREFYTFDARQQALAKAAGLKVKP
ncbi:MAG: type II toxin-antitoxin system VapC family toxin [Verrucomicrobiales bacterium]|nr:type II toxin-antitoxin system VapC family toxin [Verrucomicrobiales bacterium]